MAHSFRLPENAFGPVSVLLRLYMIMSVRAERGRRLLLLGVDGGGTTCRARLADLAGRPLGEGLAGPANIRLALEESIAAVRDVTGQCLQRARIHRADCRIIACLALAGACEPVTLAQAQALSLPFEHTAFTTDARAACVGAHDGKEGGIIIVGTGSIGWAMTGTREHRVGGWGFPVSDEASGAWLGCEALRRMLRAHDGLAPWTSLLRSLFGRFGRDPYAVVRWMGDARPRDYAGLAPEIMAHTRKGDVAALDLVRTAAAHIDQISDRLVSLGVTRVSLVGGLAAAMESFLSERTRAILVPARGDALSGALHLARAEAVSRSFAPAMPDG
jgi:glucosamine kinase